MEAYRTSNLDLEADVYMCIVFFIISMKQMFRPILLSCVLCQDDVIYALFYFLID